MSSTIIYAMKAFRVDFQGEPRYAVAAEVGASNCTMFRDGREVASRAWQIMYLGSAKEVIVQALETASHCEGGMVKWGSRRGDITPESYISKVQNKLTRAIPPAETGFTLRLKRGWEGDRSLSAELEQWLSQEGADRRLDEFWPLWTTSRSGATKEFPAAYAVAATYGLTS